MTVAEFEELAEWFHANRQDLATKGKRLQLGNGHTTTVADLERRLRAGAKSRGAGLLAVELRKLRG